MIESITFDIETIPLQRPLTEAQTEEYLKRRETFIKRKFPNQTEYSQEDYEAVRGITMATTPYLGEIVCIGMHHVDSMGDTNSFALTGTEPAILANFWKYINNFNGVFVSFNGLDFDAPFIVKRSMNNMVKATNNSFLDLKRFSKWPHFDVKAIMGDYDKYASGTLDLVCDFLGIASPKKGEIKADGVEDAYKNNQIDLIAEYCLRDVIATYKCYHYISSYTYTPTKFNK